MWCRHLLRMLILSRTVSMIIQWKAWYFLFSTKKQFLNPLTQSWVSDQNLWLQVINNSSYTLVHPVRIHIHPIMHDTTSNGAIIKQSIMRFGFRKKFGSSLYCSRWYSISCFVSSFDIFFQLFCAIWYMKSADIFYQLFNVISRYL